MTTNRHISPPATAERVACGLVIALGAAVVAFMTWLTPLHPEDYGYSFMSEHLGTPINNLWELLRSHAIHWHYTNGRTGNLVASLFSALLGRNAFIVCNALMMAAVAVMINRMAGTGGRLWACALTMLYVVVLWPVPGQTILWLAGTCSYLWGAGANLLLLVIVRRLDRIASPRWWNHVAVAVAAVVAGSMHEAVAIAMILSLAGYYAFNRRQFTPLVLTLVVAYLVGMGIVGTSPAGWKRALNGNDLNQSMGLAGALMHHATNAVTKTLHFFAPALAIAGYAVVLWRRGWARLRGDVVFWAFAGSWVAMAALDVRWHRAYTWLAVTGLMSTLQLAAVAMRRVPAVARLFIAIVALGACVLPLHRALAVLHAHDDYHHIMEQRIAAAPANDGHCVVLAHEHPAVASQAVIDRWTYPNPYNTLRYGAFDEFTAAHYGKRSIRFLPPRLWALYEQPSMTAGLAPMLTGDSPATAGDLYCLPSEAAWGGIGIIALDNAVKNAGKISDKLVTMDDGTTFTGVNMFTLLHRGRWHVVMNLDEHVTAVAMTIILDGTPTRITWHTPEPKNTATQ